MIKAIVFDIGGVLLRTEDRNSRNQLEEKYHLPPGGAEQLVFNSQPARESTIGMTDQNAIWQSVAKKLCLSPQELNDFIVEFWKGDQLDKGLIEFLQECRPMFKTALLSNAWMNAREDFAKIYNIVEGQTVDHLLISSELGVAKPDNDIYHILSKTLQCDFKEILFIDDFIENIESAQNLGINTIHYKPKMDLINEIKSRVSPL